jgi:hypothetical protein
LAFQDVGLVRSQLEHEVGRETARVASDSAIERASSDAIKHCQIGVQQHLLPSHKTDQSFDSFNGNQLRHSEVIHERVGLKCPFGTSKALLLLANEQDGLFDLFRLNQRCLVPHISSAPMHNA